MSARGSLGGLSTATTDAITALDAFGKDKIIIETVGAGQNEIDIVKTADSVVVLVPPSSGDDIQMLKAGILEIADLFVVNKADLEGAHVTVRELREMINMRADSPDTRHGSHAASAVSDSTTDHSDERWTPPIVETVATADKGVDELLTTIEEHEAWLRETGTDELQTRKRYAAEIRRLVREDLSRLVENELAAVGGLDAQVDAIIEKQTDPYTVADEIVEPFEAASRSSRDIN
jgi:LAO/AO transport system kinase